MIRHIVLYRLNERSEQSKRALTDMFETMRGKVPPLRGLETGVDFMETGRSYDVALITTFESRDDFAEYVTDPYHCGTVKEYVHKVAETSISVDYEF